MGKKYKQSGGMRMDLFDKIGNVASETYKFTAEKTSKIAKEAKIKMKINECKSKISDLYEEIGKIVYQKHLREEEMDIREDIQEYCMQIDSLSKTIEESRMELLNLKDKKQCEECFAEIEISSKFCPNCGAKQPNEKQDVKEAEIIQENLTEEQEKMETETNTEEN